MSIDLNSAFQFAVENIIKYGDTDIFPFPIENHIFHDNNADTIRVLESMHTDFLEYLNSAPPVFENMLASAGYNGFRWVTQIDPIWNAYFLGLVISIADDIEKERIPLEKNHVFSYRVKLDNQTKALFDEDYGWRKFQEESLRLAESGEYEYVLICDISSFYQSIYHHRIENSLAKINIGNKSIEKNIMAVLQRFSNIKSYGLPIGGQASRILAELLLNRTDKLLYSKEIRFCRFVDDYHIFGKSEEEIYSQLLYLSKILIENEGLSIQKSKTRIITVEEFINTSTLKSGDSDSAKNIFSISLKYDPYSLTADEDYERLKKEIEQLDILTVLSQELNKTRIHSSLMKKIISSLKFLESQQLEVAINVLLDNIDVLSPVFPNLMILFESVYESLLDITKNAMTNKLRTMINNFSYITKIDLNALYVIRILAKQYNDDNEIALLKIYGTTESNLVKRDIILVMAKWNASHWISDIKNRYANLTLMEKRSFLLASYSLGDEGKHWREHTKDQFSHIDLLYRKWISGKNVNTWVMPI